MKEKYRLYIDEVGSPDMAQNKQDRFENIYFGHCGIVISESEQEKLRESFLGLKDVVVKDKDLSPNLPIHRKDILDKKGSFSALLDSEVENVFNNRLLETIKNVNFQIFFCALDKNNHNQKYKFPIHPYMYMFDLVFEKYVSFLEEIDCKGDIMIESRGPKENKILSERLSSIYESGIVAAGRQMDVIKIKNTVTSKNIKFVSKADCVAGIELSDLLAIPSLFYVLDKKGLKSFNIKSFNQKIVSILLESKKLKDGNIKFTHNN